MIEIKGLYKFFDTKTALDNINTVFEGGVINMIIGSSGSGKTVLLKCIVGLLDPDQGGIFYDGRNFTKMSYYEKREIRRELGMLFQGSALFNSMTVFDNVSFPLRMHGIMTKEEIEKRVAFCLERVNLEKHVKDLFPQELSGGMQKRVGIARAISTNPKYLFYDEPNSGLDPKTSRVIDDLIKDITSEYKTTTIINSHDMTSVYDIADKVVFIYEGKNWWEGSPANIAKTGNSELFQMIRSSGREIIEG